MSAAASYSSYASYRLILAHWGQQRSNEQGWRLLALLAALVFAVAGVLMIWGRPVVARFVGGNLIMTLVTVYWGALVVNLLQQNQPNAARLVPGHLARLRRVLVAGWLLASLLMTPAAMLMGLSPLPAWLVVAWCMAIFGLLMRWPLGWALLSLLPFVGIWLYRYGVFAEAATLLRDRPALCALLSLALPPLLLVQILGDGGDRHRASHARAERWRQLARQGGGAQSWDLSKLPAPLAWIALITQGPYRQQLRRLSLRRDAASLGSRLMLGLGPETHWTAQLSSTLIFGMIFALVCLCSVWIPVPFTEFLRAGSFGLTIGLLSALLGPLTGLGRSLVKTRQEQCLLVLLPGVPRGPALNSLLARRWFLQYGLTWLLGLAVAIAVMAYSGASVEMLLPFLLAYLLPVAMVWRDWARLPSSGRGSVLLVFCVIASALLGYALYKWMGVPIWLYGGLQLALAGGVGAWRWRTQMRAPQALPVGRLA